MTAQLTGNKPGIGPSRQQRASPTTAPTLPPMQMPSHPNTQPQGLSPQMQQYGQSQVRGQYILAQEQLPAQTLQAANLHPYQQSPVLGRIGSDPSTSTMSPSEASGYLSRPTAGPSYGPNANVPLPSIAPLEPSVQETLHDLSAVPQHLQYPPLTDHGGGSSSEFLNFTSQTSSPEPIKNPADGQGGVFFGDARPVLMDGFEQAGEQSQQQQQAHGAYSTGALMIEGAHQQQPAEIELGGASFEPTGLGPFDGPPPPDTTGGDNAGPTAAWMGSLKIAELGDTNAYTVSRVQGGPVLLRQE